MGASSLVGLTRVCNAIRSVLVLKWKFARAGPHHEQIIPEVWLEPDTLVSLAERIELFYEIVELRLALTHDARRSLLEGLFGRNAIEPALLGELFVAGEIEPDQEAHFAVGGGSFFGGWRSLGFGFFLGFGLWFFGFRGLSWLFCLCGLGFGLVLGTFELELQFFVEAKSLLPAFEFVARELGFLFVGAKIEEHVGVGHKNSLRCRRGQVKLAGMGLFAPSMRKAHFGNRFELSRAARLPEGLAQASKLGIIGWYWSS